MLRYDDIHHFLLLEAEEGVVLGLKVEINQHCYKQNVDFFDKSVGRNVCEEGEIVAQGAVGVEMNGVELVVKDRSDVVVIPYFVDAVERVVILDAGGDMAVMVGKGGDVLVKDVGAPQQEKKENVGVIYHVRGAEKNGKLLGKKERFEIGQFV